MSQHLDDLYQELISSGATDEDARRDVLMELNYEDMLTHERPKVIPEAPQEPVVPRNSGPNFLANLLQGLHYALRQFQRNPGFALVAILTLGLGIGASTAIFSVIDNVLLEPFPYKDAGHIIYPRVHGAAQGPDEGRQGFSSDELTNLLRRDEDRCRRDNCANLVSKAATAGLPTEGVFCCRVFNISPWPVFSLPRPLDIGG